MFTAICFGNYVIIIGLGDLAKQGKIQQFKGAVITWLGASAVADILITLALVWSLSHRKTGFKSTDDQISKIIRLTVQTGAVTSTAAIADIVVFITLPATSINFVFGFALSKLYTNSLLSTLNARGGWERYGRRYEETNVLFGTQDNSETVSSGRAGSTIRSNRHTMNNGIYELERQASVKPNPSYPYETHFGDLEHSNPVAKVVERIEDPTFVVREHGSQ